MHYGGLAIKRTFVVSAWKIRGTCLDVSVPNRTMMRNLVCLTLLLVAVSIATSEGSGRRVQLLD